MKMTQTPRSMHDLALAYASTRHGLKSVDPSLVRKWHKKAAMNGYARSQWLLGKAHGDASSVMEDRETMLKKAFYWTHQSAMQGYVPAQAAIADMYRQGHGIAKNEVLASAWEKASNRSGLEQTLPLLNDQGMIMCKSLQRLLPNPKWNEQEAQHPPFNLVKPADSKLKANILGASALESVVSRRQVKVSPPTGPAKTAPVAMAAFESTALLSGSKSVKEQNSGVSGETQDGKGRPKSSDIVEPQKSTEKPSDATTAKTEPTSTEGTIVFPSEDTSLYPTLNHLIHTIQKSSAPSIHTAFSTSLTPSTPREYLNKFQKSHPSQTIHNLSYATVLFHNGIALGCIAEFMASARILSKAFRFAGSGAYAVLDFCYDLRLVFQTIVSLVLCQGPLTEAYHDALLVDVFINMGTRSEELQIVYITRAIMAWRIAVQRGVGRLGLREIDGSYVDPVAHEDKEVVDPTLFLLLGGCWARLGKFEKALEAYNDAVKIAQEHGMYAPEVWYQRGVCYSNMSGDENMWKCITDMVMYLSLVPSDERVS
jgi:tetratricopeptide (TPR) repeat protein